MYKQESRRISKNSNFFDLSSDYINQKIEIRDEIIDPSKQQSYFNDYKGEDVLQQLNQSNMNKSADSNKMKDIRQGDLNRQKWIFEQIQMVSNSQQKDNQFDKENEFIKGQINEQSEDISCQELETNNYPFKNNSFEENTQNQYPNNPFNQDIDTKSAYRVQETNDSFIKPRQINQRQGRTSYRFKPEDFQIDATVKMRKYQKSQTEEGIKICSDSMNYDASIKQDEQIKNKIQRTPHQVWITGFFKILIFVNRFLFRNKQKLIHFKPNELKDNQLYAINDLVSFYKQERGNKQSFQIYRSKYKIIRKLKIMSLLARKKLKLCIIPINTFYQKIKNLIKIVFDPLPIILPYYKISLIWDIISITFILINVFTIPFEISFIDGDRVNKYLTKTSMIIQFINFFMLMNTAYYENGVLQKSRSKIVFKFIKNNLVIEFLAFICLWYNPLDQKLLRIFFLVKFYSFYDIVQKFSESFLLSDKRYIITHMITLSVEIIFICHLFACCWYQIGMYQEQQNWQPNWISASSISELTIQSRYITSLYFTIITIGTIGYGDIVAKSDIEKIYLSGITLFSCGVFAYIITSVQNVYRDYIKKQEDFFSSLADLNRYLDSREVNPNLQQMARKYLKYINEQDYKKGTIPCQILNNLSKFLREEIIEEIFNKSINNIQFLKNFSPLFQKALAIKMKEINYGPDEMILREGQYQTPAIYYIFQGEVEVSIGQELLQNSQFNKQNENQQFFIHKEKEVFGQFEFISQQHAPSINVKSLQVTTIHYLCLSDFIEVLNQFALDKEKYHELKDKLNFNQSYTATKIFCYSCKSSQHLIKNCPIFFYKPIKERVINKYLLQQEEQRKKIQRSNSKLILNALAFQNEIEDDCVFYREQNYSEFGSQIEVESARNYQNDQQKFDNEQTKNIKDLQTFNENYLKNYDPLKIICSKEKIVSYTNILNEGSNQINKIQNDKIKKVSPKKNSVSISLSQIQMNDKEVESSGQNLEKDSQFIDGSIKNNILKSNPQISLQEIEGQEQNEDNYLIHFNATDSDNINKPIHKRSSHRSSTKIDFYTKATLCSARTVKNWLNFDKKNETTVQNNKEQRFSWNQQHHNFNQNGNNLQKTLTIGEVKSVLEQLQMVNTKKVIKHQYEPLEDIIPETIKTYKIYMTQNNVGSVIRQYNLYQIKERNRKKKLKQSSHNIQ